MGDLVKWGILIASIAIILALFVASPLFGYIEDAFSGEVLSTITTGLNYASSALYTARGLLNLFFFPPLLTCCLGIYFFSPLFIMVVSKIKLIYHYIFK